MNWLRVPPVLSPIAPGSLVSAALAVVGLRTPATESLARLIAAEYDAREVLLTDSGTSALVLALQGSVPAGAPVAMPGYACIDVIAAAAGAGMRVILYDVDPGTLSPDLDSARAALLGGARALVVAPLYGYPADMAALAELASKHGVPLIEDAAQGAGGEFGGKRLGSFGDASVLSFGRGKGTTGGSGGALLLRQPALVEWGRAARTRLGASPRGARDAVALAAQWLLARPLLYAIPTSIPMLKLGEMVYHPAKSPRALSSSAAAVIPTAIALASGELRTRREHAAELMASAPERRFKPVRSLPRAQPGYLRLAMLDSTGLAAPNASLGAVRGYPITLDEHPETQRVLTGSRPDLPGARVLRDRLFTLPTHSRVATRDLASLRQWLGAEATLLETQAGATV